MFIKSLNNMTLSFLCAWEWRTLSFTESPVPPRLVLLFTKLRYPGTWPSFQPLQNRRNLPVTTSVRWRTVSSTKWFRCSWAKACLCSYRKQEEDIFAGYTIGQSLNMNCQWCTLISTTLITIRQAVFSQWWRSKRTFLGSPKPFNTVDRARLVAWYLTCRLTFAIKSTQGSSSTSNKPDLELNFHFDHSGNHCDINNDFVDNKWPGPNRRRRTHSSEAVNSPGPNSCQG